MRRISREYDSTVGGRHTSVLRRDDVTDLLVGAVRWVEFLTATKKLPELSLESGQLALSRLNITEFRCQQRLHVGTRHGALTAQIENAGDLYNVSPAACPLRMNASRPSTEASYSRYPFGPRSGGGSRPRRS